MPDDQRRRIHAQNRRSWNSVTAAHNSHKVDQAGFLRQGGSTLFPEEVELLGPIDGMSVAHLQCNCGQDTLGFARLGAVVTGVDISDAAIEFARELSESTGIPSTFVRSEVYEYMAQATNHGRFDVVVCTYGALAWLEDLQEWARGVASLLRPGGRLVVVEFHPLVWCFDSDGRVKEPYFLSEPIHEPGGVNDYVCDSEEGLAPMGFDDGIEDYQNPEPAVAFQWTVSGLVQATLDAGLSLEALREYPHANGCKLFDDMRPLGDRRFALPEGVGPLPLMLGLAARKTGTR